MTAQRHPCPCHGATPPDARATTSHLDRSMDRAGFVRGVGLTTGSLVLAGASGALGSLLSPLTAAAASAPGLLLGSAKTLRPNQALAYTDPASGDPALLVRLLDSRLVSYDAVCTHAGCTVGYDPTRRLLACPCHGALFDPTRGAAVVGGPAPSPLGALAIRVDAQENVYALDGKPSSSASGTTPAPSKLHPSPPANGNGGNDDGGRHGGNDDGGRHGGRPPGNDD